MVELHLGLFMHPEVKKPDVAIITSGQDMVVLEYFDALDVVFMGVGVGMDHLSCCHVVVPQHEIVAT
jgi:hypothetical protein